MESKITQPALIPGHGYEKGKSKDQRKRSNNHFANKMDEKDRPFHDWYRFVLSYPPHLVREYFDTFDLSEDHTVLDPFCGTGTTLVEAKRCS